MATVGTIMSGAKNVNNAGSLSKYALFMGGVNVTNAPLQAYDPLRTGYGRLFMLKEPAHLAKLASTDSSNFGLKWKNFKHILEYGNTSVQGISDYSVNFDTMTGGYGGRQVEIPTGINANTDVINVTVYEFSGSPIREMIHMWINNAIDLHTSIAHYGGISLNDLERLQANQSAEMMYVSTDNTGERVEYACLLANVFPGEINLDVFNYNAGEHNLVTTTIPFHCVKYESIQVNKVAQALINKYKVLANSLNFYSGYEVSANDTITARDSSGNLPNGLVDSFPGIYYNPEDGTLVPGTTSINPRNINAGKVQYDAYGNTTWSRKNG